MTAKKKNPLKGLDDFLKQEASSLVTPDKVSVADEGTTKAEADMPGKAEEKVTSGAPIAWSLDQVKAMALQMIEKLNAAEDGTEALYEIALKTAESLPEDDPKRPLLINTVLYVIGGEEWKSSVQAYWEKQS